MPKNYSPSMTKVGLPSSSPGEPLAWKFHERNVRSAISLLEIECKQQLVTRKQGALRGNKSYQESSKFSSL